MKQLEGVANTLFVPLAARIAVSKEFPEYFYDKKALELEPLLPPAAGKGATQYTNLASAARYYNMDRMVQRFAEENGVCSIVNLGAGLETAYDRLHEQIPWANWYEVDFRDVIEVRKTLLGRREKETLIAGDLLQMKWAKQAGGKTPTLLVVSGVFQYFHTDAVISFIQNCKAAFPGGEIIFDATSEMGLMYTNWFIRRTGNKNAQMFFGIDDSEEFARKCGAVLLEEKTFFPEAIKLLGRKCRLITRLSMTVAEWKKLTLIVHMKL